MRKLLTIAAVVLMGVMTATAIPAKRVYRTYTQADGTTVTAMKVGDEFGHYYVNADGRTMLRNADGKLRVADDDAIKAVKKQAYQRRRQLSRSNNVSPVTGSKYHGIGHFSAPFPRTGKSKGLVFLVEFTDVKFRLSDPKEYFTRQLNEPGFNEDGARGSARDYFLEQSQGLYDPTFEVYGPVTLKNRMSYYGGNNDARAGEMILEAVQAFDDEIDYSQYDLDDNGNIDNVFVIYAGYGEADYDDPNTVWPHAFEFYNEYYEFDGKRLYGYACANEITPPSPTKPTDTTNGIATFCHEFSHVLGLPDLYNTDDPYDLSTPSSWDLMDYGTYNDDGRTPPNYSAVERNAMGWMFPEEFVGPESISLESLTKSNKAYIIPTNLDNEFFVVENRQKDGWDSYLPGHGLLVWHISFNQTIWDNNEPNVPRRGFNIGVDIVEAGGYADASVDDNYNPIHLDTYPFPGRKNVTSLTADTYPALRTWAGVAIDYPITDISESNGIVSFNVCGGHIDFETPAAPVLEARNDGTIRISWKAVPQAIDYELAVSCEGEPFGAYTDFAVGNVTEYLLTGVAGERDYAVKVRAVNGRQHSEYSPEATITTPTIDFIYLRPVALSAVRRGDKAVLSWESLSGARKYAITVESETAGGTKTETHDFGRDDKLAIPANWQWSGRATDIYKSTTTPVALIASGAPVLKFAKDKATLTSEVYASEITHVSFWLVGNSTSAGIKSVFTVEARENADAEWTQILVENNVNKYEGKGATLSVDVPEGMHQIQFVYTKPAGGGNVGLDNVAVSTIARTFTPILTRQDVGEVLTYTVDVPAESTALRFFVEGIDAESRYSKPSNTVALDFTSGVGETIVSGGNISVAGRSVIYRGAAGQNVSVVSLAGITIANALTDAAGVAEIELPSAGLFIIVSPEGSRKVSIR